MHLMVHIRLGMHVDIVVERKYDVAVDVAHDLDGRVWNVIYLENIFFLS